MYVNEILARLQGSANKPISDIVKKRMEDNGYTDKVRKSIGRQNEVVADKFAGIYGYGPEQASALLKMEKDVSRASAFVSKINKQANDDFDDMNKDGYKFDVHPHVIQRINEEIKTLESELAKADIDPKLVKMMQEQVEQLKALRDAATTVVKEMDDKEAARARYYEFVQQNDPDAVDEEIEKAITVAFDDLFEE